MTAILVGLNYHRVGNRDPANPYHRLHTVARAVFEAQITHAATRGRFVTLDDVAAGRLSDGISFLLTFDDVSATLADVRSWLADRRVPFHICPTTGITTDGFGTRDKVNWIIDRLDPAVVTAMVTAVFGPNVAAHESFYHLTKAPDRSPETIERTLIEPLFECVLAREPEFESGAYLSWADIADGYTNIINHSAAHRRMDLMDEAAIAAEIAASEAVFAAEISTVPIDFAVPFGEFDQGLAQRLDTVLGPLGYRAILWVERCANLISGSPLADRPFHLGRLHAALSLSKFEDNLDRAIADARPLLVKN